MKLSKNLKVYNYVQEEVFPLRNKLDKYEDSEEEDEEEVENDIEQNFDDSEEKNINDSDIEGAESGSDDLPNDKAWGQLRRSFYNTDYLDKDHGGNIIIFNYFIFYKF